MTTRRRPPAGPASERTGRLAAAVSSRLGFLGGSGTEMMRGPVPGGGEPGGRLIARGPEGWRGAGGGCGGASGSPGSRGSAGGRGGPLFAGAGAGAAGGGRGRPGVAGAGGR